MRTSFAPNELKDFARSERGVDIVDVQQPEDYAQIHLVGARSVPLDSLVPEQVMASRREPGSEPLYVVSRNRAESLKALEKFHLSGYFNVLIIDGGVFACAAAGLTVEAGEPCSHAA